MTILKLNIRDCIAGTPGLPSDTRIKLARLRCC